MERRKREIGAGVKRENDTRRCREGIRCVDRERTSCFCVGNEKGILESGHPSRTCLPVELTCATPAHGESGAIDNSVAERFVELATPDELAPVLNVADAIGERHLRDESVIERGERPSSLENWHEVRQTPV